MNRLIPLTEYVLEQGLHSSSILEKGMINCRKYTEFITQKLELWMFIPCDLDNNVLEEPTEKEIDWYRMLPCGNFSDRYKKIFNYLEAKDRVLFKGFCIMEFSHGSRTIVNDKKYCRVFIEYPRNNVVWRCSSEFKTIEDLTKYKLELTNTAKKQIGL